MAKSRRHVSARQHAVFENSTARGDAKEQTPSTQLLARVYRLPKYHPGLSMRSTLRRPLDHRLTKESLPQSQDLGRAEGKSAESSISPGTTRVSNTYHRWSRHQIPTLPNPCTSGKRTIPVALPENLVRCKCKAEWQPDLLSRGCSPQPSVNSHTNTLSRRSPWRYCP